MPKSEVRRWCRCRWVASPAIAARTEASLRARRSADTTRLMCKSDHRARCLACTIAARSLSILWVLGFLSIESLWLNRRGSLSMPLSLLRISKYSTFSAPRGDQSASHRPACHCDGAMRGPGRRICTILRESVRSLREFVRFCANRYGPCASQRRL